MAHQFILGKSLTQKQLKKWEPWLLMQTISGTPLDKNIASLSIAIGNDQEGNNSELNLRANLSLN